VPGAQSFFGGYDYAMILPMLLLTLFALGILLFDLMVPPEWKRLNAYVALGGLLFAASGITGIPAFLWFRGIPGIYRHVEDLHRHGLSGQPALAGSLYIDAFTVYFWSLFLAAAAIAILMSIRYLDIEHENHGEYYSLILFSVIGMMCMAAGVDIVLIFIGLELMAISTYILVGFLRSNKRSNEAALKYLLLGAFSSGIFAYGLSLFYGLSGSTNLAAIAHALESQMRARGGHISPVAVLALLATMVGLFFKIAAVPFHQWAPDAYEGAPTSITGYMSVAVKAAAWAMLLRILLWGLGSLHEIWVPVVIFVSIATMTAANLAALTQTNLKRLLAYSSIAHVGYILLALVAIGTAATQEAFRDGFKGILLYLLVYTFMNLGAFAVVTSLRHRNVVGDEIDDIAGLYSRAPVEAVLMLLFLLSLAGIPPLAGFYGKYFVFLSLIESGHFVLATLGVAYSVFGLYYYLKIANAMFMREPLDKELLPVSFGMRIALGLTACATLGIGILPEPFIRAVNWSLGLG
jgi:NADH-quinone oxidoreductase subunit N